MVIRRKGLNPLLEGIIIIALTLTTALIVGGWLTTLSEAKSSFIVNKTRTQLSCQYAGIYVSNVSFRCFNSACFDGVPYKVNATIENIGSSPVRLSDMYITLSSGISYLIPGNETTLSAGLTETKDFNSILITTDPDMPTETMDTRYAYVNDTNTAVLWHFDEASGTSASDSSNGTAGTLKNGTTTCQGATGRCPQWNASGKFNGAITFDGIDDYVQVSDTPGLNTTTQVTVEAWIYPHTTTGSAAGIVSKGPAATWPYSIAYDSDGKIYCYLDGFSNNVSFSASNNAWQHVALVYNGTDLFCYLDGVLQGSKKLNSAINQTASDIFIGNATSRFNGTIDEVRISDFARNFTTNLTFNVSHPNLKSVSVFNHTHQIFNANASGSSYNTSLSGVTTATDYRVEVEDTSSRVIRKYHPYRTEGQCVLTSALDTIRFSTVNCPEIEDVYKGSDVFFVNCP